MGIGVSFGEEAGDRLGYFITATLAIHNIPEGLAVKKNMDLLFLILICVAINEIVLFCSTRSV